MPTFTAAELVDVGTRIFIAAGVREPTARQLVESLVLSNLLGVDSHGFVRIPQYLEAMKAGTIVPDAEPEVVRDNGVAVLIDGHNAFGQIVAKHAMQLCIERAKRHSICAVSFAHVMHVGRIGEWATLAADEGLIGLVIVNGSRPGGLVSPFGARQRVMGTNPIAFAIPAGSYPPLVADFSTSAAAEGRVRVAMHKAEPIPLGWVIDRDGRPTTNPKDLYDGGALLTFGEHKGFSLSLLAEVVAGIMSGANTPCFPDYKQLQNGVFMLVIDQTFFRKRTEYFEAVDRLFTIVKQALPMEGMQGALIPGEPERQTRAKRERDGIPIDEKTWGEIVKIAMLLNVSIMSFVST